jgi:hypothetical protein
MYTALLLASYYELISRQMQAECDMEFVNANIYEEKTCVITAGMVIVLRAGYAGMSHDVIL